MRERVAEYCAAACYAGLVAATIAHHEPWADEAQAWLLARDASLIELWTRLLHYEGTPGLWHTLLHGLIRLGIPYAGLNVLSGLLGCGASWLLIRHAPLPLFIRIALPFTYYLCYQYSVISRSYSLAPVLLFGCAFLYRDAVLRLGWLTVLLSLLAFLSAHALVLSFAIWLVLQLRLASWNRRNIAAGTGYLLTLALVALASWPARDVAFPFHAELTATRAVGVTAVMLGQAFAGHWIASVLAISLSIPFLWRGRALLVFVLSILLLCAVSVIVYWNAWSQGLLMLAWIFSLWVAAAHTRVTPAAVAALVIVMGCQCYWTARSVVYDWNNPYSGSREAARFLSSSRIASSRMYGIGYSSTAIQPYFPRNVFANINNGQKAAYWDWSDHNRSMDPAALSGALRPEYVLIGYKAAAEAIPWANRLKDGGYQRIRTFEGHLFWQAHIAEAESFDLYRSRGEPSASRSTVGPHPR